MEQTKVSAQPSSGSLFLGLQACPDPNTERSRQEPVSKRNSCVSLATMGREGMGLSQPGLGHSRVRHMNEGLMESTPGRTLHLIAHSQIKPGDLQTPTNPVIFGNLGFNCQLI